jgi:hypothetical protein
MIRRRGVDPCASRLRIVPPSVQENTEHCEVMKRELNSVRSWGPRLHERLRGSGDSSRCFPLTATVPWPPCSGGRDGSGLIDGRPMTA